MFHENNWLETLPWKTEDAAGYFEILCQLLFLTITPKHQIRKKIIYLALMLAVLFGTVIKNFRKKQVKTC